MVVNRLALEGPHPVVGPYLVGREKIREFATAVGSVQAAHHDLAAARALGYSDLVAPPTFATVLTLGAEQDVVRDPDVGLDWSRVVHREQRFVHHRPVVAGDLLFAQVHLDDVREVAGSEMIGCRTEVTDDAGVSVITSYSVLVSRGAE